MGTFGIQGVTYGLLANMSIEPKSFVRLFTFLAIVGTLVIYGQTINHGFGFDDELTTQLHPVVAEGVSGIPEILSTNYLNIDGQKADYRPMARVSFAIEQSLFGSNPNIGHIINLVLYVICLWLLMQLIKRLVPPEHHIAVGYAVLLFAIHPIHTEVVASLKNREEILAAFFILTSWLSALWFSNSESKGILAISATSLILALMSKISAAPFALIIPLSIWYIRKDPGKSLKWVSAVYILGAIIFFSAVAYLLPWEDRTYLFIEKPLAYVQHPFERLCGMVTSVGYYMKMAVWPYPQSIYYGYDAGPSIDGAEIEFWVSLIFILGLLFLTVTQAIKRTVLGLGLTIFILALIPVSNIFYPIAGTVIERGLFLPSIGVAMAMGVVIQSILDTKMKAFGWVFVLILGSSYLDQSYNRTKAWASFEGLVKTDLQNHPRSAKLHQLLGSFYLDRAKESDQEEGMPLAQKAADHFEASLNVNGDWAWLNKQLALTHAQFLSRPDKAIPYFNRELELKPGNFTAAFNLAKCFAQVQEPDSSLKYTEITLSIKPDHFPSLRQISRNYLLNNDTALGLHYLRKLENHYPESEESHLILAEYRFSENDTTKAIAALEEAVRINPKNDQTLKYLFNYYHSIGDSERAEYFRDVASMN